MSTRVFGLYSGPYEVNQYTRYSVLLLELYLLKRLFKIRPKCVMTLRKWIESKIYEY